MHFRFSNSSLFIVNLHHGFVSDDWTELYRPSGLDEVVGNPKAVDALRQWADAWSIGKPVKKVAVLIGPPGVGKTSAALALANEFSWDVVEMNASDHRNADAIKAIALRGALGQTFTDSGEFRSTLEGNLKLIILDEADNFSGKEDRGGIPAVVEVVRNTKQPVILIVNDWYALSRKSTALKNETEQIKFSSIKSVTIRGVLRKVARDRGISITDRALELLATNANGDMRSAIRDLQAVSTGKSEVTDMDATSVSYREVEKTMYNVMDDIFKSKDADRARKSLAEVDEPPETKLLWIEENIPVCYRDHLDLYRGMKAVATADKYLGRVYRRQYFGFWSYASDFLSFGVCAAKSKEMHGFLRYNFPQYLMKMSRSKGMRAIQNSVCSKLGEAVHTSSKQAKQDVLPYFSRLYRSDPEFALKTSLDLELEQEEIAYILGEKLDSASVKRIMKEMMPVDEKGKEKKAAPKSKETKKPPANQSTLF